MTRLPQASAVPDPASLFTPPTSSAHAMSSDTTASPTPTPLPAGSAREAQALPGHDHDKAAHEFKLPKLRLHIENLSHPGSARFLAAVNASPVFAQSVQSVLRLLYQKPSASVPGTRSVTLYLEDMDGVAYTTGSSLDNDHKEIRKSLPFPALRYHQRHWRRSFVSNATPPKGSMVFENKKTKARTEVIRCQRDHNFITARQNRASPRERRDLWHACCPSGPGISSYLPCPTSLADLLVMTITEARPDFSLRYIHGIKEAPDGAKGDVTGAYEIQGVLVHELVHCYQHNGHGTCPSGLIEGIADFVRLKANLGARHWKRSAIPEKWDQGYEKTAYFLDWLETTYGEGTVRTVNEKLRAGKYVECEFWQGIFKADIDELWHKYVKALKKQP